MAPLDVQLMNSTLRHVVERLPFLFEIFWRRRRPVAVRFVASGFRV